MNASKIARNTPGPRAGVAVSENRIRTQLLFIHHRIHQRNRVRRSYIKPSGDMKKKGKSVRFAVHRGDDSVVSDVYTYPSIPDELFPDVYWSCQERYQMFYRHQQDAQEFIHKMPHLSDCIDCLHGFDLLEYSLGRSTLQQDIDGQDYIKSGRKALTLEWARFRLASSGSRGLEPIMSSMLSQHKSWFVRKVLYLQQNCRSEGRNIDQIAYVLHKWCIRVKAPSIFARQLALGDEEYSVMVAADEWKPDDACSLSDVSGVFTDNGILS